MSFSFIRMKQLRNNLFLFYKWLRPPSQNRISVLWHAVRLKFCGDNGATQLRFEKKSQLCISLFVVVITILVYTLHSTRIWISNGIRSPRLKKSKFFVLFYRRHSRLVPLVALFSICSSSLFVRHTWSQEIL
jgi:hypothetical protein